MERGWREAGFPPRVRAILAFAEKVARDPSGIEPSDVEALRASGLGDGGVLEVVTVVGLFAYFNTVVEALGVADEPEWQSP